jgi:hypothetical protein
MADIDLKTETPDTTLPTDGFLFGADSQSAASPSVYPVQSLATTLLGSTTLSGATVTADAPVLNLSQTWNDAAVTFTGLKFNATDTASAAGSRLLDLQVGGASAFSVLKGARYQLGSANLRLGAADAAAPVAQTLSVQSVVAGTTDTAGANLTIAGSQGTGTGAGGSIVFQVAPAGTTGTAQNALVDALRINGSKLVHGVGGLIISGDATANSSLSISDRNGESGSQLIILSTNSNSISIKAGNVSTATFGAEFFKLSGVGLIAWASNSGRPDEAATLVIRRDANDTLAQRRDTNPQTFRVYNTFTSATNFERAKIAWSSNVLQIGTEKGADGGTARALELQTDGTTRLTIATDGAATFSTSVSTPTVTASSTAANTSAIASTGYSLTGSSAVSLIDLAGTWNTTGTPTALKLNITDTASDAASLLLDLQVGGTSKAKIDKDGDILTTGSVTTAAPAGGTAAAWKLGARVADTTTLDTTQYIEVDVGGTLYKLAVVTV